MGADRRTRNYGKTVQMLIGRYWARAAGDLPCESRGCKPRAIAIIPAPIRSGYTAGIPRLL